MKEKLGPNWREWPVEAQVLLHSRLKELLGEGTGDKITRNGITAYKVVTADTFEELERAVNQRLKEGWQLWGYMTSTNDNVGDYLAQVMVKHRTVSISAKQRGGE